MKPVIVMPMSDPQGLYFPHLSAIMPHLRQLFAHACIAIPPATQRLQPASVTWLANDPFFHILYHNTELPVGRDFWMLYDFAAADCHPDQVLHLCFIDRVAFVLQSEHSKQFTADMQSTTAAQAPLLFQRSTQAWATHPHNYRELEQTVTRVGELIYGQTLDFAWCHFVVTARQLQRILPSVKNPDLSMAAEMVLLLREQIQIKTVDWLAWEDPFVYGREADPLRQEREQNPQEIRKRLGYVIPMLQTLYHAIP